ncbi:MAG: carbohydrate kinase family protein [Oceanospirillaceae bacterium]|nr:carbohydrate kinase family protein [Oceanospirillaceae bacterium]
MQPYSVVVGGANMDLLGLAQKALKSHTSNPGKVSSSPGGVGRNIAENLARLGQTCMLMAPVGNDANGALLKHHCHKLGVQTQCMVVLEGQSTSTYLSIVSDTGEMEIAIADMALIDQFGKAQLKAFLPQLKNASMVILDANLSPNCLAFLVESLPNQLFFVDTVSVFKATRMLPFLSRIHSLKPNLLEAQALAGTDFGSHPSNAQLVQIATWFMDQGVKNLYLSLGAKGLLFCDVNQCFIIAPNMPANTQDIVNSNGAGDAMMAAIADAWLQGHKAHERTCAALACAHIAMASQATINPHLTSHLLSQTLKENPCSITPLI